MKRKLNIYIFHEIDEPVYSIRVAAELVGVHPRTLRIYDEEGLVCPKRRNNNRLYSQEDLVRVQRIHALLSRRQANVETMKSLMRMAKRLQMQFDQLIDEFFTGGGE